ncbi:MAG: hypothetical protein Q9205_005620 [Flavoplaca limonia]
MVLMAGVSGFGLQAKPIHMPIMSSANPGRGRTKEEQNELRSKYKPGEQVLPRVRVEKVDAADERMLAEVREMSLRDAGVRSSGSYERGTRHRAAERRRNHSSDGRERRRHQQTNPEHELAEASSRRQIGHQSSLRSLMSGSDIDSSEMEEEILRLVDEGWLDGIDLNNLDTSQVDELSERIADAYRRRHGSSAGQRGTQSDSSRRPRDRGERHPQGHANSRNDERPTDTEQHQLTSHPPVSRPRLLEAYPTSPSQQRRASSEQRRQTSPSPRSSAGRISSTSQSQAARSATDLSQRPSSSAPRPPPTNLNNQGRRITDPSQTYTTRNRGHARSESTNAEQSGSVRNIDQTRPTAEQAPPRPTLPPRSSDPGQTHTTQVHLMQPLTHLFRPLMRQNSILSHRLFATGVAGRTYNTNFTGIARGVRWANIIFAHVVIVLDEVVFIGMGSGMQRYKDFNEMSKTHRNRKIQRPLMVSSGINSGALTQIAGRISVDDGDKGWRKCPNGHRMIVVGFEDSSAGQRRVIVKDLVGGLGLKDAGNSNSDQNRSQELSWHDGQQRHVRKVFGQDRSGETQDGTASATPLLRKYPPNGGTGMRALAVWSYWPEDGAADELPFPRGAEIREVEDINGDWFLGSYCGKMGVFPSNHVRILDVVKT